MGSGIAAVRRWMFLLLPLLFALIAIPSVACAQPPAPPTETVRYWTASYLIAVMGIVLGLLIVLRPGTRSGDEQQ